MIQKASWRDVVSSPTSDKHMASLCRAITKTNSKSLGLLKNSNGKVLATPKETLSLLINNFFPGNVAMEKGIPNRVHCTMRKVKEDFFTELKVKTAFHTFSKYKSLGPDGVSPITLQNLSPIAINKLTNIFNASITLGYVPTLWPQAKVVFIPKNGRDDYSEVKSVLH